MRPSDTRAKAGKFFGGADGIKLFIAAAAGLINSWALVWYLGKMYGNLTHIAQSIFIGLGCVIITKIIWNAWNRMNLRIAVFSCLVGLTYAAFLVFGVQIYVDQTANCNKIITYIRILSLSPVLISFSVFLLDKFHAVSSTTNRAPCGGDDKKKFIWVYVGTFALWLFFLLVAYPGIYGYDSVYQMKFFNNGLKNACHPIPHTFLLGALLTFGKNVFGQYEAGMFLYSLLQMAFLDYVVTRIYFSVSRSFSGYARIALLVGGMTFFPTILLSFSATKDVFFAGFFALFLLSLFRMLQAPDLFFARKKEIVALTGWMLLSVCFRTNVIYVLMIALIIIALALRKYWKTILLSLSCVVMIFYVLTGPVYRAFGIIKPAAKESLSVPIQQMSRLACRYPQELSKEELNTIQKYIPDYQKYDWYTRIADQQKGTFNHAAWYADKEPIIKLWVELGLRCPTVYLDSFLNNTLGYWFIDIPYPDPQAYHPYLEYKNSAFDGDWILLERKSLFPVLDQKVQRFVEQAEFQNIPLISLLFSPAFPLWLLITLIAAFWYNRQYRSILLCVPVMLYFVGLNFGPTVLYRYLYPVVIALPILAGGLTFQRNANREPLSTQ